MEIKNKEEALVKSPSKDHHKRIGKGFSLSEIKESGKSIDLLNNNQLLVDYRRRTSHAENVDALKKLKPISRKAKPRTPFTPKDKKRTEFRPQEEKLEVIVSNKEVEPISTKSKIEKKPTKKETVKSKIKEKGEKKEEGTSLSSLSGLGPATASKFKELGVTTVEELVKEDPSELSTLIKGVSEDRIKKWIEEGRELLQ